MEGRIESLEALAAEQFSSASWLFRLLMRLFAMLRAAAARHAEGIVDEAIPESDAPVVEAQVKDIVAPKAAPRVCRAKQVAARARRAVVAEAEVAMRPARTRVTVYKAVRLAEHKAAQISKIFQNSPSAFAPNYAHFVTIS